MAITGDLPVLEGHSQHDGSMPEKMSASQKNQTEEIDFRSSGSIDSVDAVEPKRAPSVMQEYTSRLDIETLIRGPVEQAWGETAVVVCGGREVVARTRNCVSWLSDERAVHKGTGAQGIYLHVEEYSF